jgi:ADP-ribose pyrophosphatase YjhB (NUDIX family)
MAKDQLPSTQMSETDLSYPENMLPRLRFRYCPMCASALRLAVVNADAIPRPRCPACGWVHYPTSALGVVVVVHHAGGIVAILPPYAPADAPAALPAGHCEYGEPPEQSARREVFEETGLEVEIIRCIGSIFSQQVEYPGPNLTFMYEARSTGGTLRGSEEGRAAVYAVEQFPAIASRRKGSRRAWQAYLALLEEK